MGGTDSPIGLRVAYSMQCGVSRSGLYEECNAK